MAKQSGQTIMLVGEGEPMAPALRLALDRHGCRVVLPTGKEMVREVTEAAPDLVILVGAAAKDGGREMLRSFASSNLTSIVPVALLTNDRSLDDRLKAFRSGAVGVIPRAASVHDMAKRIVQLARELPERPGQKAGSLGEATLDELVGVISEELRAGILSVEGGNVTPIRLVFGPGRPVAETLEDFVQKLRALIAGAEPVRYEFHEAPGGRVQLLGGDEATPVELSALAGVRIFILNDDPSRADELAQQLRKHDAVVALSRTSGEGLDPARGFDPDVIVFDAEGMQGPAFDWVRTLRRDVRLRWASLLVAKWEDLCATASGRPDVEKLAARIAKATEQDRALKARVANEQAFDTRLEATGPVRMLRALAAAGGTLHVSVHSTKASVEIDIADGLVVGCQGYRHVGDAAPLEGLAALSALLMLSSARVEVRKQTHPAVANVMAPVDEALAEAAGERPPIEPSLPPPSMPPTESEKADRDLNAEQAEPHVEGSSAENVGAQPARAGGVFPSSPAPTPLSVEQLESPLKPHPSSASEGAEKPARRSKQPMKRTLVGLPSAEVGDAVARAKRANVAPPQTGDSSRSDAAEEAPTAIGGAPPPGSPKPATSLPSQQAAFSGNPQAPSGRPQDVPPAPARPKPAAPPRRERPDATGSRPLIELGDAPALGGDQVWTNKPGTGAASSALGLEDTMLPGNEGLAGLSSLPMAEHEVSLEMLEDNTMSISPPAGLEVPGESVAQQGSAPKGSGERSLKSISSQRRPWLVASTTVLALAAGVAALAVTSGTAPDASGKEDTRASATPPPAGGPGQTARKVPAATGDVPSAEEALSGAPSVTADEASEQAPAAEPDKELHNDGAEDAPAEAEPVETADGVAESEQELEPGESEQDAVPPEDGADRASDEELQAALEEDGATLEGPSKGPEDEDARALAGMSERERERVSDGLVLQGHRVMRGGRYLVAQDVYRKALRFDRRNPRAMAGLAKAHLYANQPEEALEWANRAARRRPKRASYRILRGDALSKLGKEREALAAWRKAVKLEPGNRAARRRLR